MNVVRRRALQRGCMHVEGADDIDPFDAARRRLADRAADERDAGASLVGGARERRSHLAARQVGDAAYRIYGLESRACGEQHLSALQALRLEEGDQVLDDFGRLQHAPVAAFPAGLLAARRAEDGNCRRRAGWRRCAGWPGFSHISTFIAGAYNMGALSNGHVYLSSLSGAKASPLKIYHWETPDSQPETIA